MADLRAEDRLVPLGELGDFRVAPGNPDIRGWDIYGTGDEHLGEVRELIVDTGAGKARYLVAAIGGGFLGIGRREVIVPIGRARLDDVADRVYLDGLTATDLNAFPEYHKGRFDREQERTLFGGGEDRYAHADYDTQRFMGTRAQGDEYLTLHEERLEVEKSPVQVGEAVVRKRVEVEQVHQDVPVMREDVTIERRPLAPGEARSGDVTITDDEVHIPLMAEEATVHKNVVATEEVVIKKTRVEGTQAVEAELRKERVDLDTSGVRTEVGVPKKKEPV
jgi:uncharacterized protein (TIGR02271 family)